MAVLAVLADRGRGVRRGRVRRWLPWSAGLLALALPLSSAGLASAATLGDNPMVTASVNGRVLDEAFDGTTLYLVGEFTQATDNGSTVSRNYAAAIDTTTGHLLPWNPDANGIVYAVAVDPVAGEVYLGGAFSTMGGVKNSRLAQVSASDTGAVTTTWKHPANGLVRALSVGNGRLYVGGRFTALNATPRAEAAALSLSTGALDPSWQPVVAGGPVYAVTATPGRVYLGANATTIDGLTQFGKLAAVDPTTGALDLTFNVRIPYIVYAIDVSPTAVNIAAGGPGGHLWSIAPGGAINWLVTADGDIQAVTDIGGLVVAGGHFDYVCSTPYLGPRGVCVGPESTRKKLFAVTSDGVLQPWEPDGDSALGTFVLRTSPDGTEIAAGGDFTGFHFHAIQQAHVAVFTFS